MQRWVNYDADDDDDDDADDGKDNDNAYDDAAADDDNVSWPIPLGVPSLHCCHTN